VKLHAPAAERNREPIRAVLEQIVPAAGTVLEAEVRGKRLPAVVAKLPFAPHRFHRG